jgi:anti-anti-sigma factor
MDIEGAAQVDLRMNIIAGTAKRLLIDLSQVSFIGSMGLRSLVVPSQAVRRRGGKVVLLSPVALVEQVLQSSRINDIIPVRHDLDAALSVLEAQPN